MKGQSGFVMIFLLVILVMFIFVFMLSFVGTVRNTEYTQFYTTNLLISIMRADTGETDPSCRYVADAIYCSFISPSYICGTTGVTCGEIARNTIDNYLDYDTSIVKKSFKHYLIAEPEGSWNPVYSIGNPITFSAGDISVMDERRKTAANEFVGSGLQILNLRLFVAES